MKKCPYCAELIQNNAVKCRYCSEWIERDNKEIKKKPKSQKVSTKTHIILLSIIVTVLLFIAIFPIEEYGYYVLLRWIVCFVSVYIAYRSYQDKKLFWAWIMGIIALIFNPIIPFHLSKEIWVFLDIITALLFVTTIFIFRKRKLKKKRVLKENKTKQKKEMWWHN